MDDEIGSIDTTLNWFSILFPGNKWVWIALSLTGQKKWVSFDYSDFTLAPFGYSRRRYSKSKTTFAFFPLCRKQCGKDALRYSLET